MAALGFCIGLHVGLNYFGGSIALLIVFLLIEIVSGISIIVILCLNGWIKLRQPPPGYFNQRDIPNAFLNGLNIDGEINPVQIRTPPPLIQNHPPRSEPGSPISVDSNPSVGEDQGSRDETQSGNNRLYPFFYDDDHYAEWQREYFWDDDGSVLFEMFKGFESHYSLASILQDNIGIDTSNFEPEELKSKTHEAPLARADEFLRSAERDFYKPVKINRESDPLASDTVDPNAAQSPTMSRFDLPHIDSDETIPLFH